MKIALAQIHADTEIASNIRRGKEAIEEASAADCDLIVFPELSFSRFYPQYPAPDDVLPLAQPLDGRIVTEFREASAEHAVTSVINFFEREDARTYDTSVVIGPDGAILGVTRMLHITEYACFHEQGYYQPGDLLAPVFNTPAGRVGVCICYDRHFPEVMRSFAVQGADLVVVPQAGTADEWPGDMYTAELRVASFQNGYFCALANRVGVEGAMEFAGESFVTDPFGRIVAQASRGADELLISELDMDLCSSSPARKLFLEHRRPEIYKDGAVAPPGAVASNN